MKAIRLVAHIGAVWLVAIAPAHANPAQAGEYPARPVTIITPSAAGGSPDTILRILSNGLSRAWGQQVVVINRPGAGGLIAAQAVPAAPRDGHTLYLPVASSFVVLPTTHPAAPVRLDRDLAPIGLVADTPMVIAVTRSLGVNTLSELIEMARKRPAEILYAGGVRGSLGNLTGELLASRANVELTYVNYLGTPSALADVMTGRIGMVIDSLAALSGPIHSRAIKALAVTSAQRLPDHPDLPTVAETFPEFQVSGWFALMAPAGTPEIVVQKISRDLQAVLGDSEVRRKFEALGTYAHLASPEETAAFIRREQQMWEPIVQKVMAAER